MDPQSFDYAAVAEWNAASRRLVTVVLQKVSRLLGRPLTWIGVPELQARGLTHWHLLVAGVVPRGVPDLAVNGGVNWTGRRISPATHEGHQLGPVFDAQLLTSREDRHRAGRYVAKGLPSAEELSAPKTDYRRRVTGQLGRMRAEKGARPRHWRIPPALLHRHAPETTLGKYWLTPVSKPLFDHAKTNVTLARPEGHRAVM